MQRKLKISLDQPDEKILEKYKIAFPEASEQQLADQIRYEKMVHQAVSKKRRKWALHWAKFL